MYPPLFKYFYLLCFFFMFDGYYTKRIDNDDRRRHMSSAKKIKNTRNTPVYCVTIVYDTYHLRLAQQMRSTTS